MAATKRPHVMLHVRVSRGKKEEDGLWCTCTYDDDTSRDILRRKVRRTGVIIMRNQIFCLCLLFFTQSISHIID